MTYEPDAKTKLKPRPLPNKAILGVLRSPSETELKTVLKTFAPLHHWRSEAAFLAELAKVLEHEAGLSLTYSGRAIALLARQQARHESMKAQAKRTAEHR